jgi:hypothetical protein
MIPPGNITQSASSALRAVGSARRKAILCHNMSHIILSSSTSIVFERPFPESLRRKKIYYGSNYLYKGQIILLFELLDHFVHNSDSNS